MKKILGLLLLSGALLACNDTDGDGNKDINIHIDLDSTGKKIEKNMDEFGDSASAKAKRLQKRIDATLPDTPEIVASGYNCVNSLSGKFFGTQINIATHRTKGRCKAGNCRTGTCTRSKVNGTASMVSKNGSGS